MTTRNCFGFLLQRHSLSWAGKDVCPHIYISWLKHMHCHWFLMGPTVLGAPLDLTSLPKRAFLHSVQLDFFRLLSPQFLFSFSCFNTQTRTVSSSWLHVQGFSLLVWSSLLLATFIFVGWHVQRRWRSETKDARMWINWKWPTNAIYYYLDLDLEFRATICMFQGSLNRLIITVTVVLLLVLTQGVPGTPVSILEGQ